jgi:hypothetical protein
MIAKCYSKRLPDSLLCNLWLPTFLNPRTRTPRLPERISPSDLDRGTPLAFVFRPCSRLLRQFKRDGLCFNSYCRFWATSRSWMTQRFDIQPTKQTIIPPAANVRLPTVDDFIWAHSRLERVTDKSLSDDCKVLMTAQNKKVLQVDRAVSRPSPSTGSPSPSPPL